MASISSATIVAEIGRSISRCESYGGLPQAILWPVAQRLGASAGAFFQIETDNGTPQAVEECIVCGPFTVAADLYRRGLFRDDPLFRSPPAAPALLSDMLAATDYGKFGVDINAYRRDFLLQNGIGDTIGIYFRLTCGTRIKNLAISFQRPLGMCNYTVADMALLVELTPILKLALCNIVLGAELKMYDQATVALTNAMRTRGKASDEGAEVSCIYSRRVPHCGSLNDDLGAKLTRFGLTTREVEIVRALGAGHSNGSMASSLGISTRTVENHLRAIYTKTRVNSRTQLLSKLLLY